MNFYELLTDADTQLDLANVKTAENWLQQPTQFLVLLGIVSNVVDVKRHPERWPGWLHDDEKVWRENVLAVRTLCHGLKGIKTRPKRAATKRAEAILAFYLSKLRVVLARRDQIRCRSVDVPGKGVRFFEERLPRGVGVRS